MGNKLRNLSLKYLGQLNTLVMFLSSFTLLGIDLLIIIFLECGGALADEGIGMITSPGWPNDYPISR